MDANWRELHGTVINKFLTHLNNKTDSFILKGGTALSQCYNLNRFSEDIDLDARKENILHHVQDFCKKYRYDFRVAKDTATVKRCFIHYGNEEKPLKVEVSYRNQRLSVVDVKKINGISVYSIDKLAQMKSNAYNARDKIRDLFDIAFIVNHYYDDLSNVTLGIIADALQYKGLEQVDYVLATQRDELIDSDKLIESFLQMHEKLGLMYDDNEKEIISEYSKEPVSAQEMAEVILKSCDSPIAVADKLKDEAKKMCIEHNNDRQR